MARDGVSYEQVKAAADTLVAEGRKPTLRAVREQLGGTGSPNTIQRHLTKWRDARPQGPTVTVELPQTIIREIHAEIARAADTARAEIQERLAESEQEAADLAREGERLQEQNERLEARLAELTTERDVLAGKAEEQGKELVRLGHELDRERNATEQARIEVAQARLTTDAQGKQLETMALELEQLRNELRQERTARTEAQREHAAAAEGRAALAERVRDLQEREQSAIRQVTELRERLDALNGTSQANATNLARVTSELKAASESLTEARAEIARLREQKRTTKPSGEPRAAAGGTGKATTRGRSK